MKIVRFNYNEKETWGILNENKINIVKGNIFSDYEISDEEIRLDSVNLLAPCVPTKGVCVGLNYSDHAKEMNLAKPEEPIIFIKPSSALNHPEAGIEYPSMSKNLHYEAELAIVIKKQAHNVSKGHAKEYILGYTCANDVTARDLQNKDGQWTRCKSFDGFMPIGPCIETGLDADNLDIKLFLNNQLRQCSNTSNFIFKVDEIVSFVSQVMTLYPGDVILTGTPSGIGPMQVGDKVAVEIEGIGRLENIVVKSEM